MDARCILILTTLLLSLTEISSSLNNTLSILNESSNNEKGKIEFNRLPSNIKPISYKILFQLNQFHKKDSEYFDASANIELRVYEETDTIILHAKQLIINVIILKIKNRNITLLPLGFATDGKKDLLEIAFRETLNSSDDYELIMKYRGLLNNEQEGIFRSSYESDMEPNKTIWFLGTNFKHNHARQAFPCFDDPNFKATFKISIENSLQYKAISNTLKLTSTYFENEQEELIDRKLNIFDETPKMSTHAIGFILSNLNHTLNKKNLFYMREKLRENSMIKYASNFTEMFLKEFEKYTNISLGNNSDIKIIKNIIAPLGFNGKIISENWRFFLFREWYFLSLGARESDKVSIALLFSSSMIKNWLGYLVTPDWWNDEWLTDGFANYFHYYITDKIEKNWQLMDLFVIDNIQNVAFSADNSASVNPINHCTYNLDDYSVDRQSIIFNKAGAVIRMMAYVIGKELFDENLKDYIKTMSYGSATKNDLFDKLNLNTETITGFSKSELKEIFNNWVDTPGFPIIHVTRDYDNDNAVITQERYLLDDNDPNHQERYWIAINYAQKDSDFFDTRVTHWFNPNETSLTITNLIKDQWVIFNKLQFGYYRVNYDEKNWDLIIEALQSPNYMDIDVRNRAQLIDDAFNLARISKLNYSIVLRLMSYLLQESNYIPWEPALRGLMEIRKILYGTVYWDQFKNFTLNFIREREESLGYHFHDNDTYLIERFRKSVISFACQFGSKQCQIEGWQQINKWLTSNDLHQKLEDQLFCAGATAANYSMRQEIFDKLKKTEDQSSIDTLLRCFNKYIIKDRLNTLLNESISEANLVSFSLIMGNIDIADIINFIVEKFSNVKYSIIQDLDFELKIIFSNIGDRISSWEQISKLKKLDLNNEYLLEALEIAEKRMRLVDRIGSEISEFYNCYYIPF